MILRTSTAVFLIAAILILPAVGSAAVVRVPGQFRDIQKAIDNASAGDTVMVDSGLYKEALELHDSVVLMGVDRHNVIVFGVENRPVLKVADNSLVRDLTLRGGSCGVLAANKVATIERCIITENKETGVHCLISLPLLRNNVITRNKSSGVYCESVRGLRGVALEHNVIAENGYCGLMLAGKCEVMVLNNVFLNNKQYGIWAGPGSRKCLILHNCFFNNRSSSNRNATVNKTNVAIDPAFEPLGTAGYDYFRSKTWPLRGLGKDGADIGLMDE